MNKDQVEKIREESKVITVLFNQLGLNAQKACGLTNLNQRVIWAAWFNLLGAPFIYKNEYVSGLKILLDHFNFSEKDNIAKTHPLLNKKLYKDQKSKLQEYLNLRVINPYSDKEIQIEDGLRAYLRHDSFFSRSFERSGQQDIDRFINTQFNLFSVFN